MKISIRQKLVLFSFIVMAGNGGIGIGLANVNRIVVRHGGKCWAESEVG